MPEARLWRNIPDELKQRNQWCVANILHPDPLEQKAPLRPWDGAPASSTDKSTWGTFQQAASYAYERGWAIGFILSKDDPYLVIDLDVKNKTTHPDKSELWTTAEDFNRYMLMIEQVQSYTERSNSGLGIHIWVRASIEKGLRHRGVEFYSADRFMITTGDVYKNLPIFDKQELITTSVEQIRLSRGEDSNHIALEEIPPVHTDQEIYERAMSAENGFKFSELWNGRWEQFNFPSQSEAELAFMSILTFYSKSNEQVRRLTRMSPLGKWDNRRSTPRTKIQNDNRILDKNLALIRTRQAREAEREKRLEEQARELFEGMMAQASAQQTSSPTHIDQMIQIQPDSAVPEDRPGEIQWPPGVTGKIAKFIYNSAPRSVKEVAIVAALGFVAGVAGKAYHVPQSGLNVYCVLVALSAVGKEAMHTGLAALLESLRSRTPQAMRFIEFGDPQSGPALQKMVMCNPSFCNVYSEWGRKLKRMAETPNDGPMATLRTAMTGLYQKSGPQSIVGGMTYSDKDKNVMSVSGVAYSMIGETTPSTYYECLTNSMMEDGFLSRFTMIEYDGKRVSRNRAPVLTPDPLLADHLANFCNRATGLLDEEKSVLVEFVPEADKMMWDFEDECDAEINKSNDESWRQMWNRAVLKAIRIASLLAVADNYVLPVVTVEHFTWAKDLILRDIALMQRKMHEGDVGSGDDARYRKLLSVITDYLNRMPSPSYKHSEPMRQGGVITKAYFQLRLCRVSSFANFKLGLNGALDQTIKYAIDAGILSEIPKEKLFQDYNFSGKAYRILKLE